MIKNCGTFEYKNVNTFFSGAIVDGYKTCKGNSLQKSRMLINCDKREGTKEYWLNFTFK